MTSVYSCGVLPCACGGALHVDAVLVGAGGQDRVESLHALQALMVSAAMVV